jgi:hypothetical protein
MKALTEQLLRERFLPLYGKRLYWVKVTFQKRQGVVRGRKKRPSRLLHICDSCQQLVL